jgi:hypothetical protein
MPVLSLQPVPNTKTTKAFEAFKTTKAIKNHPMP